MFVIKNDEVLEMRISEAWFLINVSGNFVAYVCIDKLTDNYNFINGVDYGMQSNILGKISGYAATNNSYIFYQDPTNFRTKISDKVLNSLHLTFYDSTFSTLTPDNDYEIIIDLIITKKDVYENRSI